MELLVPQEFGTSFDRRFFRIGPSIYVATNLEAEQDYYHKELAENTDLVAQIEVMRSKEPKELDAGWIEYEYLRKTTHENGYREQISIHRARFYSDSSSLRLPVKPFRLEAREITKTISQGLLVGALIVAVIS